jgi:hypothetical protein
MANLDASTPQLKVVKKWLDAYSSLDRQRSWIRSFRNIINISHSQSIYPDETKEEHLQRFRGYLWSQRSKYVSNTENSSSRTDIHHP